MSLSWNGGERPSDIYRFSVRCDRAMNAAIEKAARLAGVSASQYVQLHFEAILDRPVETPGTKPDDNPDREELMLARSCGITVGMLRVHRAMKARSGLRGSYRDGPVPIAEATGMTVSSVRVLMSRLAKVNLIQSLKPVYGKANGYHVFSIGDER